jgi:hypothetical protein
MKVELKKDVIVDNKTKIYKNSQGIMVGAQWNDKKEEKYLIDFKEGRYIIDRKDLDFLK